MKTKKKIRETVKRRKLVFSPDVDRKLAEDLEKLDWTTSPPKGDKPFGHGIVANMLNKRYRERAKYASTPDKPRRELPTFEKTVSHGRTTKHFAGVATRIRNEVLRDMQAGRVSLRSH